MSFTLLLILGLVAALAYVGLKALRLHFEQKEHEVQLNIMVRSGQFQAHENLTGQLCHVIGTHKLLALPGAGLSEKWQKAFSVLYPDTNPYSQDTAELSAQLEALGFSTQEVGTLIRWSTKHPEFMVTLLVSLLSGLPEEQAWGVAHDI